MIRRAIVIVTALAGGVGASQLPEFAQQYRQRLGGALDEIRQVVADFDADAGRNRLTREEALATYDRADENFLRDRGETMTGVVRRYEHLARQRERMDTVAPALRPLAVLQFPDERVVEGAWSDFEPAVPVTPAGILWAGLGLLLGALLAWLVLLPFRRRSRRAGPAPAAGGRANW